ncbi:MAG: NAD-dependent epimerase/dehydratase family protein [Bacteroidota bacterium]
MKLKIIITGASGMVGEGVLLTCLNHPDVEQVLVVGRRPCGHTHAKLKEITHKNFYDLSAIKDQLQGYNACYFCLGVSSVGMNEADYTKVTYDLTLNFAKAVVNPEMTFTYVSGAHTNNTGKQMWQRVKGKTEDDLARLPFKRFFALRPGGMTLVPGQKNQPKIFNYLGWILPIMKAVSPNSVSTLRDVGTAMINVTKNGYSKGTLEVSDINKVGKE